MTSNDYTMVNNMLSLQLDPQLMPATITFTTQNIQSATMFNVFFEYILTLSICGTVSTYSLLSPSQQVSVGDSLTYTINHKIYVSSNNFVSGTLNVIYSTITDFYKTVNVYTNYLQTISSNVNFIKTDLTTNWKRTVNIIPSFSLVNENTITTGTTNCGYVKVNGLKSARVISGINCILNSTGNGTSYGTTLMWEIVITTVYGVFALTTALYDYTVGNKYTISWQYDSGITIDVFKSVIVNRITSTSQYCTQIFTTTLINSLSVVDIAPSDNGALLWTQTNSNNTINYPSILCNDVFSLKNGTFAGNINAGDTVNTNKLLTNNLNVGNTTIYNFNAVPSTINYNAPITLNYLRYEIIVTTTTNTYSTVTPYYSYQNGCVYTITWSFGLNVTPINISRITLNRVTNSQTPNIFNYIQIYTSTTITTNFQDTLSDSNTTALWTESLAPGNTTYISNGTVICDIVGTGTINCTNSIYSPTVNTSTPSKLSGIYFSTLGGVSSLLNYYEEYSTTLTFADGLNLISFPVNFSITRIGRFIQLYQSGSSTTKSSLLTVTLTTTAALPTRFITSAPFYSSLPIINGNTQTPTSGFLYFDTNGKITVCSSSLSGLGGSYMGWYRSTASYNI